MRSHNESSPRNNDRKKTFFFTFWSRRSFSILFSDVKNDERAMKNHVPEIKRARNNMYVYFQFVARIERSNFFCSCKRHHVNRANDVILHRNFTLINVRKKI